MALAPESAGVLQNFHGALIGARIAAMVLDDIEELCLPVQL